MAGIDEVRTAINAALKERGGVYTDYSCHFVSWDDVKRGTDADGGLSCWGSNITDTRLCSKDGRRLFTVRSDNWNEKLVTVDASDVALIAGNTHGGRTTLAPVTLRDFLRRIGEHGKYAGLSAAQSLCAEELDAKVSIRFQTTFLPITETEGDAIEFAASAYSYGTRDERDPKNLVVLASSQGIALQQDQVRGAMIYHHQVGDDGTITRHWLEAEKSRHAVGQQQVETENERQDALKRGKATSCVIGPKCVGTRFNALLTVQIPLDSLLQPEAQEVDALIKHGGWLYKRGNAISPAFRYRHFLIRDDVLAWYCNGKRRGWVSCAGLELRKDTGTDKEGRACFDIKAMTGSTSRWIELACNSQRDRRTWVLALEKVVQQQAQQGQLGSRRTSLMMGGGMGTAGFRWGGLSRIRAGGYNTQKSRSMRRSLEIIPDESYSEEYWLNQLQCVKFQGDPELKLQCVPMEGLEAPTAVHTERSCDGLQERGGGGSAVGEANAARVSVGSRVANDVGDHQLRVINPDSKETETLVRHPNEHITITVIFYYTVKGGVPSKQDVARAIDDLESMYRATNSARLADETMDYMKAPLSQTVQVQTAAGPKILDMKGTLEFPVDMPGQGEEATYTTSGSWFFRDAKFCRKCGLGTTKDTRKDCKKCGASHWITAAAARQDV